MGGGGGEASLSRMVTSAEDGLPIPYPVPSSTVAVRVALDSSTLSSSRSMGMSTAVPSFGMVQVEDGVLPRKWAAPEKLTFTVMLDVSVLLDVRVKEALPLSLTLAGVPALLEC